jgi:hypothetical protein
VLGIPTINVDKTCLLGDPTAFTESKGKRRVPRLMMADDGCMKSELSALDDIIKQWTDFTRGERALCIAPRVYAPSYVEWLTCLELQRDVRRLRQQSVEPKRKG